MALVTVTLQLAVLSPQAAVTVVSPNPTAVTTPFSTVAMVLSALLQTTLSVVSAGNVVAVSVAVSPRAMVSVSLSSVMPVQGLTMVRVAEPSETFAEVGFTSANDSHIALMFTFATTAFALSVTVNITSSSLKVIPFEAIKPYFTLPASL